MNNLYLTHWQSILGSPNHWYRFQFNGRKLGSIASIGMLNDGSYMSSMACPNGSLIWNSPLPTAEEAMEMCDEMLLYWGYVLLTKEQIEKLQLLL